VKLVTHVVQRPAPGSFDSAFALAQDDTPWILLAV
jgi:hypothetical protein